ncbi:MAG: type II toxin-antitoxin system PemK/MazF family toxin [Candidatus Binatia bacterium]
MRRGEIRWYTFASPDKRRPVLLLTRAAVIDTLNEIIGVPATRTIRGLSTEVLLSPSDGMPTSCALNFDHVGIAQRARLGAVLTTLAESRWPEVESALLIACGFEPRGNGGNG